MFVNMPSVVFSMKTLFDWIALVPFGELVKLALGSGEYPAALLLFLFMIDPEPVWASVEL